MIRIKEIHFLNEKSQKEMLSYYNGEEYNLETDANYLFLVVDEVKTDNTYSDTINFIGVVLLPQTSSYVFVTLQLNLRTREFKIDLAEVKKKEKNVLKYNQFIRPERLAPYIYSIGQALCKQEEGYPNDTSISFVNVLTGRTNKIWQSIEKIFKNSYISILDVRVVSTYREYNVLEIIIGDVMTSKPVATLYFDFKVYDENDDLKFVVYNTFKCARLNATPDYISGLRNLSSVDELSANVPNDFIYHPLNPKAKKDALLKQREFFEYLPNCDLIKQLDNVISNWHRRPMTR